jgi:hypothetical protein
MVVFGTRGYEDVYRFNDTSSSTNNSGKPGDFWQLGRSSKFLSKTFISIRLLNLPI